MYTVYIAGCISREFELKLKELMLTITKNVAYLKKAENWNTRTLNCVKTYGSAPLYSIAANLRFAWVAA